MPRTQTSDHLAYAMTDLMISLMVIFVLLMIVFLNNQHAETRRDKRAFAAEFKQKLAESGFDAADVLVNPSDPQVLTVRLPAEVTFGVNEARLSAEGSRFLRRQVPKLAELICSEQFRNGIKQWTVEGYADASSYRGVSAGESRIRNLRLSQDRSREVVRHSYDIVSADPQLISCLSERIEASGRGQNNLRASPEASRRVVFAIRLDPATAVAAGRVVSQMRDDAVPTPAVTKVLNIFQTLRTSPPATVRFDLSEAEVNEYLRYSLAMRPRFGIQSCTVRFANGNQLSANVEITEDVLGRLSGLGRLVADQVLGGRNLAVTIRFQVTDATIRYDVLDAHMGGRDVPVGLVRNAIRIIGLMQPEQYDTESTLPLPLGLKYVETSDGRVSGGN